MPFNPLAGLSKPALAAEPFARSLVHQGLSANRIISELATAGLTFRRTDMLSLIRALKGVELGRSYAKSVPNSKLPAPDRLPQSATRMARKYAYEVRFTGRVAATGRRGVAYMTISSDDLLTKDEAAEIAEGYIEDGSSTTGLYDTTVSVTNIFTRGPTPGPV